MFARVFKGVRMACGIECGGGAFILLQLNCRRGKNSNCANAMYKLSLQADNHMNVHGERYVIYVLGIVNKFVRCSCRIFFFFFLVLCILN